jgi:hypothetical protein
MPMSNRFIPIRSEKPCRFLSQAGCLVDPSTKPLLLKETLVPLSRHDLHRCMSAMVGTDTANRYTTRSGYV